MLPWLACCLAFGVLVEEEPGFSPLFDGQSLDGWQVIGGKPDTWKVEDGLLVCEGQGGGWLATRRDYADFVLRLEFRLTSGSNSGVYLRAPADNSHISRTGMEIQILDESHPRHKDIQPWQRTGAIYHVAAPEPGRPRPPGEWNTMEIRALGKRVSVVLNGRVVVEDRIDRHPDLEVEHPGLQRTFGRVGLQSHNDRVEFRRLRIRPENGDHDHPE
ncbi:MAG: DUF1080 domain-containing protein [Isosphaeraceae bacterium]